MTGASSTRKRPSVRVTLHRAARFHSLVTFLASSPRPRADILDHLAIGLRTFYRELDLLRRCGVRIRHSKKLYHLLTTAEEAEGRLPFPDPQLSFAEMAELARCDCPAGRRLAEMLATVVHRPGISRPARGRSRSAARKAAPASRSKKSGP
jgi:hypothetical protein